MPSTTAIIVNSSAGAGLTTMLSTDGINWSFPSPGAPHLTWADICYSPALNYFVAVGSFGACATTADGITWVSRTIPNHSWSSICWSPSLNLFVAASADGFLAHSPDGITWTAAGTVPEANGWFVVVWAASLNLFCTAAPSGTHQIMTSPDGDVWTVRTHTLTVAQGLMWDPTLAQFCTWSSNTNQSSLSTDGITWGAAGGSGLNGGNLHKGTYIRGTGGFVIGGHNQRIFTSADGVTWSQQTSGFGGSDDTVNIGYSVALGLYVGVGDSTGVGAEVCTSPDMITWTAHTSSTPEGNGALAFADSSVPPPPFKYNHGTVIC